MCSTLESSAVPTIAGFPLQNDNIAIEKKHKKIVLEIPKLLTQILQKGFPALMTCFLDARYSYI